ncbi:heparan-sulfate 6-O-sulfotransferase 1 [Fukomys damarensis]|uniref:heparan-sulfate 6-O-sulfotransferase 1 n=1 Tax=Fukomys damarensis TaxID=885580 RepID=UPI00053F7FCB|nr:heparan-sulfate 6-O-sulfotransferase 1 [Fukomys damarensis]
MKGDDVIVFLHIQKTGGTTFGRHLVQNVRLEVPCDCRPGQKKCTCYRPNRRETWLFSRFSTGWSCGLHADWTELTNCVPGVLDRRDPAAVRVPAKFYYITLLRDPVSRYLSEWRHVQRGATWKTSLHMCDGRTPTPEELPPCYEGTDWSGCTLQEFMDCPYNLANNRQVRMLADLSLVGCYNLSFIPEGKRAQLLLDSAKKNLRGMAFFGLTEFQRKTQYLFERTFNLKFIRPFMQYNSTRAGGVEVDEDTIRRIEELNDLDMQLYDYAKDLFQQRYQYKRQLERREQRLRSREERLLHRAKEALPTCHITRAFTQGLTGHRPGPRSGKGNELCQLGLGPELLPVSRAWAVVILVVRKGPETLSFLTRAAPPHPGAQPCPHVSSPFPDPQRLAGGLLEAMLILVECTCPIRVSLTLQ